MRKAWLAAVVAAGCSAPADPAWGPAAGKRVAVSFAPLQCFVANVAGPDAVVRPVFQQGPHHADFSQKEARLVAGADLFVINGLGLDDRTAAKMAKAAPDLKVLNLGGRLDPKDLIEAGGHDHDHDHGHEGDDHHHHDHGDHDPHVWLGVGLARQMVGHLADKLAEVDPAHAAGYADRAAAYAAKLDKLAADGKDMLKGKAERKLVTFHESLGYFAKTFDLQIVDVIQKTPGKEPTAKELEALVAACQKHGVRVIAVEPQYTTRTSAGRVKDELEKRGVKDVALVEIDPLETADGEVGPGWYEAKMRANLDALAKALK